MEDKKYWVQHPASMEPAVSVDKTYSLRNNLIMILDCIGLYA